MWTSRWHHVFVCENFWVKPGLGRTRGGAQLPWEDIVLSNYQPPNRQAQRGRKPLIWVFAYESAKEFPRLLCDSWTGSIWVSSLWWTTEEMWNIVTYVWRCRILSSEHNDHHHLNQKSCDSLQETPRFMPVHIFGRKKKTCGGDGEGCQILYWDSRYSIQHHPLQMNVSVACIWPHGIRRCKARVYGEGMEG